MKNFGTTEKKVTTITSNSSSNSIINLYRKNRTTQKLETVKLKDIESEDVVYIEFKSKGINITGINGNITCPGNTGWTVNLEKWTNYTGGKQNNFEQSFIRVVVWFNNTEKSAPFEIYTKTGSLQIRKVGVSTWDASKLSGTGETKLIASYKIYCVNNNQWLQGTAKGVKRYTDDFDQASIYRTENDVGKTKKKEVTIDKLIAGYKYRVYEIDVNNAEFKDSNGIPRIVDVAWKNQDDKWIHNDNQTKLCYWTDEEKTYPGFGDVSIIYDTTKTVDVRNIKVPKEEKQEIELKIQKIDSSTKQSIEGVGLQLYKAGVGWVANDDEDGSTFFAEIYSNATTYTTGEDGKISVKDLTIGTYYIYEKNAGPTYSLNYQRKKYPDSADVNGFAGKDEYSNIVYLGKVELKEEDKGKTFDNISYEQYLLNSKLTILKKDGTLENVPLSGTKIKIFGNSNASNGWIKYTEDGGRSFETYENATEFITDNSGIIEVKDLPYGKYYIFETEAANKKYYNIKEQDGYHKTKDEQGNPIQGINDFSENTDWVYLGTATIGESDEEIQFNAINKAYVSLKGKVWIDNPAGKLNGYNNIYDGQDWTIQNEPISKDELKKDIIVNLYSNKDGKNKLIANTTTNQNGEYEFKTKANGEKFTYWELAYCYVEFIYDNKEYIIATPFTGNDLEINSKAQAKEIISTGGEHDMGELYDGNLSGLDPNGDYPGKANTYQANISEINLDTIKNNQNAPQNQRLLTSYYNSDTYTIENINLGLIKKIEPSFSVGQQIEYVKIKRGNYTFKYKMRRKICNRYGRWN